MTTGFTRADMDCFRTIVAERLGLDGDASQFDALAKVLRDRLHGLGTR